MPTSSNWLTKTLQAEEKGEKKGDLDYASLYRNRVLSFRKEPESVTRIDSPTNLVKAHQLGYKAKKGVLVVRVKIRKGSGLQRRPYRGRRPKQMGVRKRTRAKSIQGMAEIRAVRKFPNCEVLNSYWVGEDGKNKYFEVILVDTAAPEILSDKNLSWIAKSVHRGRAERGLTSAGKKSRGHHRKGKGTEKLYPSLRARNRKAK
jgi:large subunit ribosomal protein L15e